MMAHRKNNVEYVLPLGRPCAEGGMTSPSWPIFVQWTFQLADHLVIWTRCAHTDVKHWLALAHGEMLTVAHPDPACSLVGYGLSLKLLDPVRVSRLRVSEDSGVAFFSWSKSGVALASIEVNDFENFAILDIEPADAEQLAKRCSDDLWNRERLLAYKAEIDRLSTTGQWIPLIDVLGPREKRGRDSI